MSGIIEYQPSEYTATVRAGTPVRELNAALREKGQYLPFDPLLPEEATIGGTVASNLSGSRRFRFGGVRDFILGALVVDGEGRAFRVGGKVVKNSAGFDLSKFLVGSLGKYAIMTELTFKVFPEVPRFRSLGFLFHGLEDALSAIYFINQSVYELDALDLVPPPSVPLMNRGKKDGNWKLLTRLTGFDDTLPQRVERFSAKMIGDTATIQVEELNDSATLWNPLADLSGEFLVKVVLSPRQIPAFDALIANTRRRYSVGGNVAWAATDDIAPTGHSAECIRHNRLMSAWRGRISHHRYTDRQRTGRARQAGAGSAAQIDLTDRARTHANENLFVLSGSK